MFWDNTIKITPLHRHLIAMDQIVQFMNLIQEQDISYEKPNFTTKDYQLKQYISRIVKQIPDNITLYDYQCKIGKRITNLDYYPRPNKLLNCNKKKWQKFQEE